MYDLVEDKNYTEIINKYLLYTFLFRNNFQIITDERIYINNMSRQLVISDFIFRQYIQEYNIVYNCKRKNNKVLQMKGYVQCIFSHVNLSLFFNLG